ncbi:MULTISPECIES: heterodisulfide reductase-related iron-sulfur binding cluster [Metallosphaera]|nr:heterodisulfide reductase-related iron-sulfur binding cluster [Metallosphaera cuprina]
MFTLNKENPLFFDSEKLQSEFIRQASVCHGCRLCFNYCPAFPKMFEYTDKKGPAKLVLEDLFDIASDCFHCNMCFVNCPYTPPHEFNMDFPHLMSWAWLYYKSKKGLSLRDRLFEMLDSASLVRPIAKKFLDNGKELMGISKEAPSLRIDDRGFLKEVKPREIKDPVAKVVLFHTCLVENFYPEIGKDVVEVFNKLNIEVRTDNFSCCGAPMLDVGDAERLKKTAERNYNILKKYVEMGYDVVSPIPTCTLMLTKEYQYILDKEQIKVYDVMEYLMKLKKEGKVNWSGEMEKKVFYHPPCHLKYLKVGVPGVQAMRSLRLNVEISNMGCSGIDGGWGLRNYDKAKVVGAKMMDAFAHKDAEIFATECPLAGLQIEKASGKKPVHPISLLKEAIKNDPSK